MKTVTRDHQDAKLIVAGEGDMRQVSNGAGKGYACSFCRVHP